MLFGSKKIILLEKQKLTVGEFDINVEGAYKNIKTFPLEVKKGKSINVRVISDNGVDVSIVGLDGRNAKFKECVKDGIVGPVVSDGKGTMALILGVPYGSLSNVEIEAWME